MNILWRFIIFCIDPLGIGRRFLVLPTKKLAGKIYEKLKGKADEKYVSAKDFVLRIILIAFAVVGILCAAIFLYAAFYYTYMPAISHTRPVHMQFKTCLETSTPCTFPHAHVPLTKKQQLLMVGQAYRVVVNIDMPESSQNLDLGMFMVCAEMRDHDSVLRGHSCRSAMMRYRSPLIRTIATYVLSPLYVIGLREEFQKVSVEIFSRYLEDRHHPITDVYVEIQSQKIQFYDVTLQIIADFTGLRYIMHNWPVLSAIIAISTNLVFILIIFLLSWYHWSDTISSLQENYARISSSMQSKATKIIQSVDEKSNGSEIDDVSSESVSGGFDGSSSGSNDEVIKSFKSTKQDSLHHRHSVRAEESF